MEPTLERAILELRAGMDETDRAAFETDLRAALSLPVEQHDRALARGALVDLAPGTAGSARRPELVALTPPLAVVGCGHAPLDR